MRLTRSDKGEELLNKPLNQLTVEETYLYIDKLSEKGNIAYSMGNTSISEQIQHYIYLAEEHIRMVEANMVEITTTKPKRKRRGLSALLDDDEE